MKKRFLYAVMALSVLSSAVFVSCDDDDDNLPPNKTKITVENVTVTKDFVQSGTFRGTAQQTILPGESVSITFYAGKGQALMFATMYGYSNDLFFAPENPGIKLFDDTGKAITGDVSTQVKLWDNGTRVNQVPSSNVNHPGVATNENIKMVTTMDAQGNSYLLASQLMQLTLAYTETTSQFTLTIKNISGGTANETPFSPGVWAISNMLDGKLINDKPFFTPDEKSSDALTPLAEAGNITPLKTWLDTKTGVITGLSPVVVVIYSGSINPLFTVGEKDRAMGLKELAQTGSSATLKSKLGDLSYVKTVYVLGSSPIAPTGKVDAEIRYDAGDNIAYATMFGYSNDWFYANSETIAANTNGDITSKTRLYDNGTALDQYPGAGNSQALFNGTPIVEDKVISAVGNTFPVPAVNQIIKVSITQ